MSENVYMVYQANPITSNAATDLIYIGSNASGGAGVDAAITYANFALQFAGNVLTTKGDLYTFSTVNTRLAVGSNGQILQSESAASTGLAWSTAVYPVTTTINQILYSSAANTIAGVTAGNYGVLISSSSGVPSWLANGTTGQLLTATTSGTPSWANVPASSVTFTGDTGTPFAGAAVTVTAGTTGLSYAASTPNLTLSGILKLANGGTNANLTASNGGIFYSTATAGAILSGTATANQILMSGSSTTPAWSTATYPATAGTQYNVLQSTGTNITSATLTSVIDGVMGSTQGDILYRSATVWTVLAPGTSGQVLQTGGAATNPAYSTATYPVTTTINQILYSSSANTVAGITAGNYGVLISSSAGVPSWLANGTTGQLLTATTSGIPSWENMAASSVTFTGDTGTPFSGAAVTVTAGTTGLSYAASSPNLTLSGVLKLANGGTNAALTASNGGIFYSTATAGAILAGTATAGQLLTSGASTTPAWTTSTYPATNAVNTLLYASSANTMAALATANNGVLVTSSGGAPSISSTLPTAVLNGIHGRLLSFQTLTSGTAATYTPTSSSVNNIYVEGVGGGGNGGNATCSNVQLGGGGGGGAGGYCAKWIANIGGSYTATYTVGGVATSSTWSDGTYSLTAGAGTTAVNITGGTSGGLGAPGGGLTSSGGDINFGGAAGIYGIGLAGIGAQGGNGGVSYFGGAGEGGTGTAVGSNATPNSGSGGGGAANNSGNSTENGGAGAAGIIIVWEFS